MSQNEKIELFTKEGKRLYLTAHERAEFEKAASSFDDEQVRTFSCMLLHTGCRISEALNLTYEAIDFDGGTITIQTLKRRKTHFRLVPLPPSFLDILKIVHRPNRKNGKKTNDPLWTFSRSTAWRYIKRLMDTANIKGQQSSPKGLRHGFGVACIEKNIPIHIVQKWMGHASPNTTTIYLQVTGQEERGFAERLW
jgi:integrase